MKVLFVSSECSPFAASGGLGDVIGALPKVIQKKGHDISVIIPLYDVVKNNKIVISKKAIEKIEEVYGE